MLAFFTHCDLLRIWRLTDLSLRGYPDATCAILCIYCLLNVNLQDTLRIAG